MRPMSNLKGGAACQCFFRHRRRYISFGTTAYEKRGIAVNVPEWIMERCISVINVPMYVPMLLLGPFVG